MMTNDDQNVKQTATTIDPLAVADDNNEVNAYYEEKRQQAEKLWQNADTKQKAIDLLSDELDQPYLPIRYYELFSDIVHSWQTELKLAKMKNVTLTQMLTDAVQHGIFEPEVFEFLMESDPDQMLQTVNQQLMQTYLLEGGDNVAKIYALDVMGQHAIDHEFTFQNAYSGAQTTVNPVLFTTEFQTKEQNESILKVNELTFKDTTLNKFSIDLLLQIFIYYFPEFPFKDLDALAETTVAHVKAMLGIEEMAENPSETNELIEKVLDNLRETEVNK